MFYLIKPITLYIGNKIHERYTHVEYYVLKKIK